MVAVQFAVLLLRLLRLPLGTQLTAPQNFSPVDAAGRLSPQPPTLLLPDADSGTLRQLQPAPKRRPALATRLAAEAAGTAFIVGGGCGAACALRDATSVSSYTMPVLWGVAVATAVTTLRESSGAHFNPAVTLAFYCYNRDGGMASSPGVISAYIAAQCTGATLASLAMASWFAPNVAATQVIKPLMPLISQTVSEMSVTALLVFSIFAIGDPNLAIPHALTPACVGTVITLINIGFGGFAIGLNPARDLGPRLIATLTGDGGLFDAGACIYLLSPILGAVLGGYAYTQLASYAQSRRVVRQAAALLRDQGVYGVVVPTPDAMRRSLEQPPSSPAGSQMPQLALA